MSTKIEWTDRTWNPTTGCNKVSPGCRNCYAEKQHARMMHMHPQKYTRGFADGVEMHEDELTKPLRWKKPQRIFVNSMSDLFHDDVSGEFINNVIHVIRKCPQHTFQILTKRAERMQQFFSSAIPLPKNLWLGISCENQQTADERIPLLLQTPAAVRFLSCEPLLGPIDIEKVPTSSLQGDDMVFRKINYLNWVIAGGESGSDARPMHPDWARSLRDQCAAAGVPFFFKQWGVWMPVDFEDMTFNLDKVGVFDEKQNFLRYQCGNSSQNMDKVGKKAAGRLLDGVYHNEFPKTEKLQA